MGGLDNDQSWTFQITAFNEFGSSMPSASFTCLTLEDTCDDPWLVDVTLHWSDGHTDVNYYDEDRNPLN